MTKQHHALFALWTCCFMLSKPVIAIEPSDFNSRFTNGTFQNLNPSAKADVNGLKIFWRFMTDDTEGTEPSQTIPVVTRDKHYFNPTDPGDVRITWMGHAAMLIEIEGKVILTDPSFSERASPFQWMGPKRFHPVPIAIDDLPHIDAILISHDHYDHLDYESMRKLAPKTTSMHVPLGVAERLIDWGIDSNKIHEYDWWQEREIEGQLKLVATPAQHFSGRSLTDRNETLWVSWAIVGNNYRVYFSGDTGMFNGFSEIGKRYGPFDFTLMHIGAYADLWQAMHMTPEEAVVAHQQLRGKLFLPLHWGTFKLAFHPWNEPAERLLAAVEDVPFEYFIPKPGEFVTTRKDTPETVSWWKAPSIEH